MEQEIHHGDREPALVAAIDLGSNSFHMIVARTDQGEIRLLDRLGKKVQLGAGLNKESILQDDAIERGLDCLAEFSQYLNGKTFKAVRIVGTNALRKAKNARAFLEKAREVLPYPIEIIAGREEARLIYLGVAQTQANDDQRLVVDIGGGSTEFIIGEKFEPKLLESLHMGCVSFTEGFFKGGTITPERFHRAYCAARLELLNIEKPYRQHGWVDVLGSSGSIKAVSSILAATDGTDIITVDALKKLKETVLSFGQFERLRIPGLRPERQGILPAGLAILLASFDALGIDNLHYSEGALREGVLYDMMGRDQHENVRERTVNALMTRYRVNLVDADNVKAHALNCFKQAQQAWELSDKQDLPLVLWAARLCTIGLDISHTRFNCHGAYIIRHSDLLGFSKSQQKQLALLIEGHRRSVPMAAISACLESDAERLIKLIVLLRLASLLNHSNVSAGSIDYRLVVGDKHIAFSFPKGWLKVHSLTKADFERECYYLEKTGYQLDVF